MWKSSGAPAAFLAATMSRIVVIDSHPSGRALGGPAARLHFGHNEQAGAVLGDDPIDEHRVVKQGLLQGVEGLGGLRDCFHEGIDGHAVRRPGNIIERGHARHVFGADGFDAGQEGNFFGEVFDRGQRPGVEDAVFGRIVVEHPDNNQVADTEALLDQIVIAHDRIVLGNERVGVALKAERLHLHPGQAGAGQDQNNDQIPKTDNAAEK